jgi:hypothetical protein
LIKSRERVAQHGEVMTPAHIVNDMLDLVKQETERIESRFLEPACGTGNFLVEILRRKLNAVDAKYRRSQYEWERNAVTAVSSLYGIELLPDNVEECRERLYTLFDEPYTKRFKKKAKEKCRNSIRYLLAKNIIWGNALSLTRVDREGEPIVFAEWSAVNGSLFKRRDYAFEELLRVNGKGAEAQAFAPVQPSLFPGEQLTLDQALQSDLGEPVFLPRPVREYPLAHFLELSDAYGD